MNIDNTYTEEQLLEMLCNKDSLIRETAAYDPSATPEMLLKAMENKDERVRMYAAANSNATPEVLLKAIADDKEDVIRFAALNRNLRNVVLTLEQWLQIVSIGALVTNIPSWVKKTPQYKSTRLLRKLAETSP